MDVALHDHGIDALLPEWKALFEADPDATVFASDGWARAWWPHWACGARPWLITVRDSGRLTGLAPLVIRRQHGLRMLRVLGKEPGDYWDILALPAARAEVRALVWEEVERRRREWDVFVLRCLSPWSSTQESLADAGLRVQRRDPIPCPAIELPGTFDEYLAALSSNRRHNLRQHLRRIERYGLELREMRAPDEIRAAMERWHDLRVRQWDERGRAMNPHHRSGHFGAFMADVMLELIPRNLALVWEMQLEGEVVGVYPNFIEPQGRAFYPWLYAFEPGHAKLGLSKIMTGVGIRESIEAGRRYYDFTVGDEPYKYWYGSQNHYVPSLTLASRRLRSRLTLAATTAYDRLSGKR